MDSKIDKKQEFLKVYDELSGALFRRFYFKLSDKELALDFVQETFTKAWQYIVEDREIRNLKSFLYTIANHIIIDEYRKKKSSSLDSMIEEGFDVSEDSLHENIVENVEFENVLSGIEKLPEKYKEIITLRYIDGLSPKEISDIVGESENAVSVRINRGIKKIQEILHIKIK